jgi:hypothetical protein
MADVIREEAVTTESDQITRVLHGGIVTQKLEIHALDGGSADHPPTFVIDGGEVT